jgi:YaiO family outer membrane protein
MLLALLFALQLGTQAPSFEQAEALAREGRYAESLDAFRRLVGQNPRDLRGRLWIAQLHALMGNPDLAEPVYRAITLEDPAMLEAQLGLGESLIALGRFDDGITAFQRAEKLEPRNPRVLNGLSTAHRLAGNTTRATAYSELAVQLSPTQQTRQTLEQARMAHNHRVELSSFGEHYNTGVQETGSADLRVNFRVRERLRVMGRGQYQRKFNFSEERGGGGFEWRWQPETSVFAHVLIGPGNVVLPRVDVNTEVAHTYGPSLWTAGYRYFDFANASVSVLSPSVAWWPTPRVSIGGQYHLAFTTFDALRGVVDNHSGTARLGYRLLPRLWVNVAGTRGTENFETLSPDRIGAFQATTVSGGARFDLPSLTSILGTYEYQWRPAGVEMGRFSLSIAQRF